MRLGILGILCAASAAPAVMATPAHGGHNEARLDTRLVTFSQSRADEKYETEHKLGAGPVSTKTTSTESSKTEGFDASGALPFFGVTGYVDGTVIGTELFGRDKLFSIAVILGKEVSRSTEFGARLELSYNGSKENAKTEPENGPSVETKTANASRDLALGPYLRLTVPTGGAKLEIMPFLAYLKHEEDDNDTTPTSEEKTGLGLGVDFALVVPLHKNLQYVGAIDLAYDSYTSGKKELGNDDTAKLKNDKETYLELAPLGLRLVL